MLEGVNAERFLTRRRLIDLRFALKDIERAIVDASSDETRAWFESMRVKYCEEIALLEAEEAKFEAGQLTDDIPTST